MPTLFTMYISYSLCIILLPSPLRLYGRGEGEEGGGGYFTPVCLCEPEKNIIFHREELLGESAEYT